jgi:hypothetical protein
MKTILLLLGLLFTNLADAEINLDNNTIWSISDSKKQNRWLIIHNLNQANASGIYHIEVLGKDKKAPAWQIEHLAKHIAITKQALLKSIIKPLTKGDVYAESFDSGFAQWQKQNNGNGGAVCISSVLECLK